MEDMQRDSDDPSNTKPFQILSLDGGGVKGLFSAAILAAVEEDHGVNVADHFDLIAGTSTGGIIALGLGLGMRPQDIVDFYVLEAPRIFRGPRWYRYARWAARPKYDQGPLRQALQDTFGDRTLADSEKRLLIPSFSLDSNEVYVFKTPHDDRLRRDWREFAWHVALSTTAAPTYFPASVHANSPRLIDGGVWANNPTAIAIAEAMSTLNVSPRDIRVLNLGTTTSVKNRPERLTNAGLVGYIWNAADVVLGGQARAAHGLAQHLIGHENVLRVDSAVPAGLFGLDKVNVDRLESLAREVSRRKSDEIAKRFLHHQAEPFTPLYPTVEEAA